jgi:hypothetical protein
MPQDTFFALLRQALDGFAPLPDVARFLDR